MYLFAYTLLLVTQLLSLGGAGLSLFQLWQRQESALVFIEKAQAAISLFLLTSSGFLLYALASRDYSLDYVASYTDNNLALFYRLTAFWAGQPGSMLFWALSVAVMGSIFAYTQRYRLLKTTTKLWFWTFFYSIIAFFMLLLVVWSNPFALLPQIPADGRGLNPLLQNPGMIIHPPLLFLGYGGFTVPSCLALAMAVTEENSSGGHWYEISRAFLLTAWCFLSAGILLGAWWAYMELGWGGFWGWDPVENASLIPWLFATATLHTLVIEKTQKKLSRVNVLLIGLTTVSGFFATYLVRSGVIDSVHAFGQGPVGLPLLGFIVAASLAILVIACLAPRGQGSLSSPLSREGALTFVGWLLIALSCIILTATMWPVISKLWSTAPKGLDAGFYNRVCLPLASIILILLAICPWISWKGQLTGKIVPAIIFILTTAFCFLLYKVNYSKPLPLICTLAAFAALTSALWHMLRSFFRHRLSSFRLGILGCHIGVGLCALGIAFSGSYKLEEDLTLSVGENARLGNWEITLLDIKEGRGPDYDFLQARFQISHKGEKAGILLPEKRAYDKFTGMFFTEVDVLPSLGEEVYASLSGMDETNHVIAKISIEPMVNWLWIGGVFLALCPLLSIRALRKKISDKGGPETA